MTLPRWTLLAALVGPALSAPNADAITPTDSAVKAFRDPRLDVPQRLEPITGALAAKGADFAFEDPRAGRPASLVLHRPLVPGDGVGNQLEWADGAPGGETALKDAVWAGLLVYLRDHARALRVDPGELAPPRIGVFEHGALVQVHSQRALAGIPVRDSGLTAIVSHGNLVLLGLQNWADATPVTPALTAADARRVVSGHVQSIDVEAGGAHLEYLPMARGEASELRLAWVIGAGIAGDAGTWEGLVDAETGELLALEDRNLYDSRNAVGGVYPVSNDQRPPDGIEQAGWPMPFLGVATSGGAVTTNAGGAIGCVAGTVSTALAGAYVATNDNCGPASESSGSGDLDLGFGPTPAATDCAVPAGHSPGDTKAARSAFYAINRLNEQARGWLGTAGWLDAPLAVNLNTPGSCNAFWNGSRLQFYREVPGACRNTGENASLVGHEWAHGLDDNGVNPTISTPAEAIADIHSALAFNMSCVSRGVFTAMTCSGYGDACIGTPATGCTGRRDVDYAQHRCNRPHTISWALNGFTSAECGGTGAAGACPVSGGTPCGRLAHCEGMVAGEAVWDLQARDLRAAPFNFDASTALELGTRLTLLGTQVLTAWHTCAVGGGCGATGGYLLFLAADDDDGSIANGTPHMTAIRAAFERHEIHCPAFAVVNSGCAAGPAAAPVLTAVAADHGVVLSWTSVAGAGRYYVYRTEGTNGPDFAKVKIGETDETGFAYGDLQNGRTYSFAVWPAGVNASCLGRMSNSVTVVPAPNANLVVEAPPSLTVTGGDADGLLDNCETAAVSFPVRNSGTGALTNVRLVSVAFLSHPGSVLQTALPAPIAATLGECGTATGSLAFVLQGGAPGERTQLRVGVTADQLGGRVETRVLDLGPVEQDAVPVTARTFDFDAGTSGWAVASGTFAREAPGANGTAFHLHSSASVENQCDRVRSPWLRLRSGSTLSLFNRYVTDGPTPIPYDRANVGIVDAATDARTTIVPTGGRLYDIAPGAPNGRCVTAGQGGWASAQNTFAESTWNAAAANPGGVFTGRVVQLEAAYATDGSGSPEGFRFDEVTLTDFDDLVPDAQTNTCLGLAVAPFALAVDAAGNSVMEPNELAIMAPMWRNSGTSPITLTGATSSFTGPAGAVYTNPDNAASYGTIAVAATGTCATGGNCYIVNAAAATRPILHWDTTILETVNPSATTKTWTLHIGETFTDVPVSNPFYRFVETILHKGITGGCSTENYCPSSPTTRFQMATFVLRAKEGPTYLPPPCVAGLETFSDLPASSPFCRWPEELARRGVVSGCGNGRFCPDDPVTRGQMAIFVLRTLLSTLNPPACVAGSEMFADVPASNPFCKWIEELVRRGVVSGCGSGNYCPTANVTRDQMAVFLTVTFGLTLYGV